MLATTVLLKGKKISASLFCTRFYILLTANNLSCGSFERLFKFNALKCSISYENIDFVQEDDLILRRIRRKYGKSLAACRCLYPLYRRFVSVFAKC